MSVGLAGLRLIHTRSGRMLYRYEMSDAYRPSFEAALSRKRLPSRM